MCGADISSRAARAKYCFSCAVVAQRGYVKKSKEKSKGKVKEHQSECTKKGTVKEKRERERERLEEEKSWELLRQAFGERFGRNHQHVNTMSQLEKDVAEATRLGISYGEYMARKRKEMGK